MGGVNTFEYMQTQTSTPVKIRCCRQATILQALGENLYMDALEQSGVVVACRDKLVADKKKATHDAIAEHYKDMKSSEVAKLGCKKLVTTLIKIGDCFGPSQKPVHLVPG